MEHAVVGDVCRFCGAEHPAPQTDCIDEYPTTVAEATRNAVKLALIEHRYTQNSDIPWATLADSIANAVYRTLVKASRGRVPVTVTVRSSNRTVISNDTQQATVDQVPQLISERLCGLDLRDGASVTVNVSRQDARPVEIIEDTLRREAQNLALRSERRYEETAELIIQKLDSWRKNGRL